MAISSILGEPRMDDLSLQLVENSSAILVHLKPLMGQRWDTIEQLSTTDPAKARQFLNELLTIIKGSTEAVRSGFLQTLYDQRIHLKVAGLLIRTATLPDPTMIPILVEILHVFLNNQPGLMPEVLSYHPLDDGPSLLQNLLNLSGRLRPWQLRSLAELFEPPQLAYLDRKYLTYLSDTVLPTLTRSITVSAPTSQASFRFVVKLHMVLLRSKKAELAEPVLLHNILDSFPLDQWGSSNLATRVAFLEYLMACLSWSHLFKEKGRDCSEWLPSLLSAIDRFGVLARQRMENARGIEKDMYFGCMAELRKSPLDEIRLNPITNCDHLGQLFLAQVQEETPVLAADDHQVGNLSPGENTPQKRQLEVMFWWTGNGYESKEIPSSPKMETIKSSQLSRAPTQASQNEKSQLHRELRSRQVPLSNPYSNERNESRRAPAKPPVTSPDKSEQKCHDPRRKHSGDSPKEGEEVGGWLEDSLLGKRDQLGDL